MSPALAFAFGFISALVMVGVVIIAGAAWWFLSYGRHIQQRRQEDAKLVALQKRKVPMFTNEPL